MTKLTKLVSQYEQLGRVKDRTSEQDQQYLDVQKQLGDLMPDMIDHIDAEGNARLKNVNAINAEINALRQAQIEKANNEKATFVQDYATSQSKIADDQNNISKYNENIQVDQKALKTNNNGNQENMIKGDLANETAQIAQANADIDAQNQKINEDIKTQVDGILAMKDGYDSVDDATKSYIKDLETAMKIQDFDSSGNLSPQKKNQLYTTIDIDTKLQDPSVNNMNYDEKVKFMKQLSDEANQAGLDIDWLNGQFKQYLNMTMQGSNAVYDFSSASQNLSNQFDKTYQTLKPINDAIDQLNNGQKLSYDTIQNLIKQNPELANQWTIQNGQMTLTVQSLEKVKQTRLDEATATLQAKEQEIQAGAVALAQQLGMDAKSVQSTEDVAKAKVNALQMMDQQMQAIYANQNMDDNQKEAALAEVTQKYDPLLNQLDQLDSIRQQIQNINAGISAGMDIDAGSGTGDTTQQLTKLEQAINDVTNSYEELQNVMQSQEQHSEAYRKNIEAEIELLQEKNKLIQEQINNPTAGFSDISNLSSGGSGGGTTTASSTKSSGVTASQLNAKLGGVFSNQGELFINAGANTGIDPALIASIAMHETGNGTSNLAKNQNNVGGITDGSGGFQSYSSLADGIEAVGDLLKSYADSGKTTIAQIQKSWAPVGAGNDPTGLNNNWVNGVSTFYS